MPRLAKPLTALQVQRARPKRSTYPLADGNGLYLLVSPSGTKSWQVRYRLPGAATATPAIIGRYPVMSLLDARGRAEQMRQAARRGQPTPGVRTQRQHMAAASQALQEQDAEAQRATFRATAGRWLEAHRANWSIETFRKARLAVNSYLVPALGDSDVTTLESRAVRPVLTAMHARVPALARKGRQYVSSIIDHAINEGLRDEDRRLHLDRIFPTLHGGHMPAVTDSETGLGEVMLAVDGYNGRIARAALILCATTAARPGMVADARWNEIDLRKAEWRIPAERMKMRKAFITPLPKQALCVLRDMRSLTAGSEYVFRSLVRNDSHLHRDALSKALRDMGFQGKQSPHGFRASFRTLARERLGIPADVLEAQLAHAPRGEVQAAYDRTSFLQQRRDVMQQWADYLDKLRDRAKTTHA